MFRNIVLERMTGLFLFNSLVTFPLERELDMVCIELVVKFDKYFVTNKTHIYDIS